MQDIIRMTEGQARRVGALIKKSCCNYAGGQCIVLDCPCPQLITRSLICKWFIQAVLPTDAPLHTELSGSHGRAKAVVQLIQYIQVTGKNSLRIKFNFDDEYRKALETLAAAEHRKAG